MNAVPSRVFNRRCTRINAARDRDAGIKGPKLPPNRRPSVASDLRPPHPHLRSSAFVSGSKKGVFPPTGRGGFGRWVAIFVLMALAVQVGTTAVAAESVVPRWLGAQTNLQTWTAAVRQTRTFKTMSQPLQETGRVWFAAPNRFRWELGSPARTIAVREPEQMLVIYPRLKRAERFPLNGAQAGPWKDTLALLEAGFPRSPAELESRFKIVNEVRTNDTWEISLQPKSSSARRMMPLLKVAFAEGDFLLRATEIQFADGSIMRNEFSGGTANPVLDPTVFQPPLDPGFEIVDPLAARNEGRK